MNKILLVTLLSIIVVMGQEGGEQQPDKPAVKPQRTLENDKDFLEKFQVQILQRDTHYNLYPKDGDEMLVHYHGMTMDEKVFDSSVQRRQPFKVHMGSKAVIRCWMECFKRMSLGDKIRVICPPKYGYGKHGVGSAIPPNSELIMEFEILAINNVSQPEEYIDDL